MDLVDEKQRKKGQISTAQTLIYKVVGALDQLLLKQVGPGLEPIDAQLQAV